jgi:AraC family transcriptional regulator of adaptative response / DNA-3-methyladenine glycosylase II
MNAMDNDRYLAVLRRDTQFDGRFVFAVRTTRIYCRPGCPAPRPLQKNVLFYESGAAARAAGFRACKRCRPDEPSDARARELVAALQTEHGPLPQIAEHFGLTERQLRRIVRAFTGLGTREVRSARRLKMACRLLGQTELPLVDIAYRADFVSVQQFSRVCKRAYGVTPRQLRLQLRAGGRRSCTY